MTPREQLRQLLHGYVYDRDGNEIIAPKRSTIGQLQSLAESHGICVYLPGQYHGRREVVITDTCYAYAIGEDGQPQTIAG